MNNFKKRLEQEKKELDEKAEKLFIFIGSEAYNDVNPFQMSLLNIQYQAMATYSQCLLERIAWIEMLEGESVEETKA